MSKPPHSNLPAIALVTAGFFCLSAMDAVGKWIVEADYSVFQLFSIRSMMIIPAMSIALASTGQLWELRTTNVRFFVLRAVVTFGAPILFFSALREMPLADATVLAFGSPLFLTVLSIPIFKEHVDGHRWAAVIFGFMGVLIVLNPTADVFQPAGLLVIGASLCFSGSMIMGRMLGATESVTRIVFYNNLGIGLLSLPFASFSWTAMPLEHVAIVALMATLAVGGHFFITRAYIAAPMAVVAPFEYSAALWALIWGYFVFGDLPGVNVWIGAPITIASGLYIVYRENLHRRATRVEAQAESGASTLP